MYNYSYRNYVKVATKIQFSITILRIIIDIINVREKLLIFAQIYIYDACIYICRRTKYIFVIKLMLYQIKTEN